jgi:hypothetical protein
MATTTKITLKDFHPEIDGEYELDWEFTKRHWRTIKKMADVTPPELVRELNRSNVDLAVALAAVALEQAGKPYIAEMLWADDGQIKITEEKDPDAGPPEPSQSDERPSESRPPSGETTPSTGEPSPETKSRNGSGDPGLESSSASDPVTSET